MDTIRPYKEFLLKYAVAEISTSILLKAISVKKFKFNNYVELFHKKFM